MFFRVFGICWDLGFGHWDLLILKMVIECGFSDFDIITILHYSISLWGGLRGRSPLGLLFSKTRSD